MSTAVWWIRRDVRLHDNPALLAALQHGRVVPLFINDPAFKQVSARRKAFLVNGLARLEEQLHARGSRLLYKSGAPEKVLRKVLRESGAEAVYAEEDFTPYARQRDARLEQILPLTLIQGQLIHHPMAIRKPSGKPFTVFTPFSKAWKSLLPDTLTLLPVPLRLPFPDLPLVSDPLPRVPEDPAFPSGELHALDRLQHFTAAAGDPGLLHYAENRDRVAMDGTSGLSPYLHFGMSSLRQAASAAMSAAAHNPGHRDSIQTWIHELAWREFYISILFHFPDVLEHSFRRQYDSIAWNNSDADFDIWKNGETGYPMVDAAMRQLKETGWMPNRARMVTASFLVKDLLIDWRRGEAWFQSNLLDADLAANNGGWQWSAGTGTDAAPYFRIFNPVLQSRKFDPGGEYIRRWVPELAHLADNTIHAPWEAGIDARGYPAPIVNHQQARQQTLAAFQAVKQM